MCKLAPYTDKGALMSVKHTPAKNRRTAPFVANSDVKTTAFDYRDLFGRVKTIPSRQSLGANTMKRDWFLIIADGFVWGIGFIAALAVLRGIFQ
jgi:hypothetical protein